jgi:mannose-6-phosphate isomerase-like protein (cupin superfamily)
VRLANINLNNSVRTGLDSGLLMEQVTQADSTTQNRFNQSLCKVNDCVVRLGVVHGDFHWHHHDDEDEFFYVLQGKWIIELEDRDPVELTPGQGFVVPKGVRHMTRAPERTVIMMIEGAGVVPTGD